MLLAGLAADRRKERSMIKIILTPCPIARDLSWDPDTLAKAAIAEIATDALDNFGHDRFWPAHTPSMVAKLATAASTSGQPASSGASNA